MANFSNHFTINNIIAIIIGIVGLIWLIHGLWRNWKINNIRSWPKTNAVVLNAVAEPANASAGTTYMDPRYIVATTNNNAQYIPIIVYRYSVNGKDYQSNNVVYSGAHSYNALDIKTIMGQIYPGSVIPVYYNPNNNSESYIYNGTINYLGVVIGIILLIIAGYILYYNYRSEKQEATTIAASAPVITSEEGTNTKEGTNAKEGTNSKKEFYRRKLY